MSNIRVFRNEDLPALADVWVAHWSRLGPPPAVNVPIIEQAVLSRTFFSASTLLVAHQNATVQAWCHLFPDPENDQAAWICAFCFTDQGAEFADSLLQAAESVVATSGRTQIFSGPVRDQSFGYAGLPPIGHGIGIHHEDLAITSLLGRHGYSQQLTVQRLVAATESYRSPVSRDALQWRRSTRITEHGVVASNTRQASALSHFDIDRYTLSDARTMDELTHVELWCSDPEALVMPSSHGILDLSMTEKGDELSPQENYLISAVLKTLAAKRIFSVETAVDSDQANLIDQLSKLHFVSQQQGTCWQKTL